ncbi:MAG: hypothetical protein ABWZ99_14575, partial [Ilumatobacteraceae bacterium]
MVCPSCGVEVVERQKFCADCGASLRGVTDPAERGVAEPTSEVDEPSEPVVEPHAGAPAEPSPVDTSEPAPPTPVDAREPAAPTPLDEGEATEAMPVDEGEPTQAIPVDDGEPTQAIPVDEGEPTQAIPVYVGEPTQAIPVYEGEPTQAIPVYEGEPTQPIDVYEGEPTQPIEVATPVAPPPPEAVAVFAPPTPAAPAPAITAEMPALFDGLDDVVALPESRDPFRVKFIFIAAFLGAIASLMAAVGDVIDIRTTRPAAGITAGTSTLDDIGSNLGPAGVIGGAVMVVGGLLACFGLRGAVGVAGGAGLALVGWAGLSIGLVEAPVGAAESITRASSDAFTLTVTRDVGWWLIIAVGGIGLVVFLASLRAMRRARQRFLNPILAAVGAVCGL